MDNNTISIKDIINMMIKKLWLIILLFIIGGIASFSVSKFIMPLKYSSYTTMYVKNNNGNYQDISSGDLNTAKSLVSTYIAVLKSDSMMKEVGEVLISDYGEERISEVFNISQGKVSESSLKNCLTMSSVDDTEVMRISADTTDAEISMAVCQTIARLAPEFLIRVVGAGSVETIDTAQINYNPVSPNVLKNTAVGAIAGMVLACAFIFLVDFFDNTVKNSNNLSSKFDKPILGELADIENMKKLKDSENHYLIIDQNVPFYIKESYKALRTNIIFSLSTSNKKIIAVSSSMPSEGKSTFSSNIAISLSQLNNKILLIDADMRKSVQHMIFGLKNKTGLSSVLGKMNETDECINKSNIENLDIMTAGPQPPNPAELLSSKQMETLLEELSAKYDYIIIDMPPVNVVSDPLSIGRLIAGLVIVVKYASTTFDDVSEIVKKSELADTKILGFVMTRVKADGKNYYNNKYKYKYKSKYGYGYGYGYGENPKKEADKK